MTPAGAGPVLVSLSDALERTRSSHPGLLAQGYVVRAAEAETEQAGQRPNPTLGVSLENFAGTGVLRDFEGAEMTVQAEQVFERGGKRGKRLELAGRAREAAALDLEMNRRERLAETAMAFVETVAARERLSLATGPLVLAQETIAAVESRVEAGVASPAEVARAKVALVLARAEYQRTEAALASARATLAGQWGEGERLDRFMVSGELRLPAVLPAKADLVAALTAHPRLDWQQALIAMRRAELQLERAGAVQDISVGGGVRFFRDGRDAALVAGFSMPIPVLHQNQGRIRAARENLGGAEQTVRFVESDLRTAFTVAWQALTSTHAVVSSLRDEALPATVEAHAIVRQAYEEGQLPLIDVLDAQRELTAIRRALLDAEISYATAVVRIDVLTSSTFPLTTQLISTDQ